MRARFKYNYYNHARQNPKYRGLLCRLKIGDKIGFIQNYTAADIVVDELDLNHRVFIRPGLARTILVLNIASRCTDKVFRDGLMSWNETSIIYVNILSFIKHLIEKQLMLL